MEIHFKALPIKANMTITAGNSDRTIARRAIDQLGQYAAPLDCRVHILISVMPSRDIDNNYILENQTPSAHFCRHILMGCHCLGTPITLFLGLAPSPAINHFHYFMLLIHLQPPLLLSHNTHEQPLRNPPRLKPTPNLQPTNPHIYLILAEASKECTPPSLKTLTTIINRFVD